LEAVAGVNSHFDGNQHKGDRGSSGELVGHAAVQQKENGPKHDHKDQDVKGFY